jgi:hypothetical protein
MEKEKEDLKIERQKYQLHKNGYASIVKAIESIPKTTVNIPENKPTDLTETNKVLGELVNKMNEPLCVKLILE